MSKNRRAPYLNVVPCQTASRGRFLHAEALSSLVPAGLPQESVPGEGVGFSLKLNVGGMRRKASERRIVVVWWLVCGTEGNKRVGWCFLEVQGSQTERCMRVSGGVDLRHDVVRSGRVAHWVSQWRLCVALCGDYRLILQWEGCCCLHSSIFFVL